VHEQLTVRAQDVQQPDVAGNDCVPFLVERTQVLSVYDLTLEERDAIIAGDIGLLYVLGANGQLLMHYAALLGMEWSAYIAAMREGVRKYGPVRAGLYSMTTGLEEKVADV